MLKFLSFSVCKYVSMNDSGSMDKQLYCDIDDVNSLLTENFLLKIAVLFVKSLYTYIHMDAHAYMSHLLGRN